MGTGVAALVDTGLRTIWIADAVLWVLFLVSAMAGPQRFRNCFILLAALGFTAFAFCTLFGKHSATAMMVLTALILLILLAVPTLLVANGITMLRKEGHSVANMLSLFLGMFVAVGEVALMLALMAGQNVEWLAKHAGWLWVLGYSVFYCSFLLLAFVLYSLVMQIVPHRLRFDYIIIHGCGLLRGREISGILRSRLDKAVRLWSRHRWKKPILIPSGGRGSDEEISEAEAMMHYLAEQGVPPEYILGEGRSATTRENLEFSMKILNQREGQKRVALVTSNYHVYRCLLYAKSLGLKCTGIGAPVAGYYWPSALIREFVAVFRQKKHFLIALIGYLVTVFPIVLLLYFN